MLKLPNFRKHTCNVFFPIHVVVIFTAILNNILFCGPSFTIIHPLIPSQILLQPFNPSFIARKTLSLKELKCAKQCGLASRIFSNGSRCPINLTIISLQRIVGGRAIRKNPFIHVPHINGKNWTYTKILIAFITTHSMHF